MSDALGPLPGLDELASVMMPVADRFVGAGHRLYLVGGVVRDLVVVSDRAEPVSGGDIDLTTDARPAEIRRLIEPLADTVWAQGERFGTIGARVFDHHVEITTHRAEAYDPESRKPTVTFGDDLEGDLERRDFTINAAAIELPGGRLHDPHGGIADLRARILRTPLSAEVSFTDDPLRMLRAARFIPRFGLTAAPELIAAATSLAARLDIVSVERVSDELERLLAVTDPRAGFDFLVETGLLTHVVPALAEMDVDRPDQPDRSELVSVAALASAEVGQWAEGSAERSLVRRAGLLWLVRHRAAEQLGRLRYSRADTGATVGLLDAVDQAIGPATVTGPAEPTPPLVRSMALTVGPGGLGVVKALVANLATAGLIDDPGYPAELARLIDHLSATEDLGDLDGPLSGAEVMKALDLDPGPDVGRAVARLRQLRLEQGPLDPGEARRQLRDWWSSEAEG